MFCLVTFGLIVDQLMLLTRSMNAGTVLDQLERSLLTLQEVGNLICLPNKDCLIQSLWQQV